MTDAEDAAEKWWKEKMAEDVPNNDDLDDLAVAYLDGVERGKDAARARIAELEAALEPFADLAEKYDGDVDDQPLWDRDFMPVVADLRTARAAYLGEGMTDEEYLIRQLYLWNYPKGREASAALEAKNARIAELKLALNELLIEAEDIFICMADATGIDRHNHPSAFAKARGALGEKND
jgi:hypothetical protein